jgi:hypothetical protein
MKHRLSLQIIRVIFVRMIALRIKILPLFYILIIILLRQDILILRINFELISNTHLITKFLFKEWLRLSILLWTLCCISFICSKCCMIIIFMLYLIYDIEKTFIVEFSLAFIHSKSLSLSIMSRIIFERRLLIQRIN